VAENVRRIVFYSPGEKEKGGKERGKIRLLISYLPRKKGKGTPPEVYISHVTSPRPNGAYLKPQLLVLQKVKKKNASNRRKNQEADSPLSQKGKERRGERKDFNHTLIVGSGKKRDVHIS